MALKDCPKCGRKISDKAPKCPHCGVNFHLEEDLPTNETSNAEEKNKDIPLKEKRVGIFSSDEKYASESSPHTTDKHSKSSKNLRLIILIIVLIMLGAGSAFYYKHYIELEQEKIRFEQHQDSIDSFKKERTRLESIRRDSIAKVDSLSQLMPKFTDLFSKESNNSISLRDFDKIIRTLKDKGYKKIYSDTQLGEGEGGDPCYYRTDQYALNAPDTISNRFPWCLIKISGVKYADYDKNFEIQGIELNFSNPSFKSTFRNDIDKNAGYITNNYDFTIEESRTNFIFYYNWP